jgi:uncharacterized protein
MKERLHMLTRKKWLEKIETLWKYRSVLWLSGVRRAGKTCLCKALQEVVYFDCELPRTRALMEDPEGFLDGLKGKRVVLDEIHRLQNPAQLLKIAADHYPSVRIIATGSSTLGASTKFKDTLTGRKAELWLTPMVSHDLEDFENTSLPHRFLRGGLPPFFLAKNLPERDFQEWIDAYWAKDIQELFRVGRRYSFLRFAELLFAQSGGIFEASRFATPCEVSRPTIANYLSILEATYVVHVIRPFSRRRPTEIVAAPKVYAFDTGFVSFFRGWDRLRPDDMGVLWEHYVLNELQGRLQTRSILYWRDTQRREIDFVFQPRGKAPITIECNWRATAFDGKNLQAFRKQHPEGANYVVAGDVETPFARKIGELDVHFVDLETLVSLLAA